MALLTNSLPIKTYIYLFIFINTLSNSWISSLIKVKFFEVPPSPHLVDVKSQMFTAGHFLVPPSESACCCGNKDSPVVYLPAHSPLITPQVSWKPACPPATPPMQLSSTLVNKASETLNHSPSQIAIFIQPLLITWFLGTLMENAPVPQPKNRTPKCEVAEEM